MAAKRVYHVLDNLREFLGQKVSGLRTIKPKKLKKTQKPIRK